jgi:predicted nuclease of predicted toxin-antitoxin system
MRILFDMNPTPRWVEHLRAAGHEVVHWSAVGSAKAKDREICEYARAHEYIVLTNDLDFPQILADTDAVGPGVVLLRGEPLVPELRGTVLLEALARCAEDLTQGAIVSLDWAGQPRARVLPLR